MLWWFYLSLPHASSLKTVEFFQWSWERGWSAPLVALLPTKTPFFVLLGNTYWLVEPWGGPRSVTTNQGRANSLLYIGLCTFQLGYWRLNIPSLYPGMVPVGPGEAQQPVCLLHTGVCTTLLVGFSLTNQNPEYMGLTLKFQWSTLSNTSSFSATPSCCYCSCSE